MRNHRPNRLRSIISRVAEIEINRKMLSEMAINDPESFTKLVEIAKGM